MAASSLQSLFAIVLENSDHYHSYLNYLSTQVGFRYVLASHLSVFSSLVELGLPANLFILRFEKHLNHQLRAYMDVIRNPAYADVPVLLICNKNTQRQAEGMLERSIDTFIVSPFSTTDIVSRTGNLLHRALRNQVKFPVWLELDRRTVQGLTMDVSASGLSVEVQDPILATRFPIRVLLDNNAKGDENDSVVFYVQLRRKEKVESRYQLGLQIEELVSGPIGLLSAAAGVQFSTDIVKK